MVILLDHRKLGFCTTEEIVSRALRQLDVHTVMKSTFIAVCDPENNRATLVKWRAQSDQHTTYAHCLQLATQALAFPNESSE